MIKSKHVSKDKMLELLYGDRLCVSSKETRIIGDHLHQCEDCRNVLDKLAAQSEIWEKTPELLKDKPLSESFTVLKSPGLATTANEANWQYPIEDLLDPPQHPEMMGRIGNFDVEREIGRGGMGVVLKAYDAELNRPLSIKILAPHLANHGTARKRFVQEARAAAGVLHPNVIAVHAVSSEGKTPFIVMSYVAGPSLQTLIDQQGPLNEIEIVRIALQISAGLTVAHSQGLVHRDIKPANILVQGDVNRVVITDFGLARAVDDASMTRTGWLTGTPNYMSPEQARGERIDPRSDLFSLGCLIYFVASGRLPFRAESPLGVLNRIRTDEPTPIRQINNQISRTLADVIELLLKKDRSSRCQSAVELHELLEKYLAYLHQPDISRPPRIKGVEHDTRRRHVILAIVALIVMLSLFSLWILAHSGRITSPSNNYYAQKEVDESGMEFTFLDDEDLQDRFDAASPQSVGSKNRPIADASTSWPTTETAEHPLDRVIEWAQASLEQMRSNVTDYTAIMIKRERVNHQFSKRSYMRVKIRNERVINDQKVPLSIYMKFLKPRETKGREVIWVTGKNNNQLIAHQSVLSKKKRSYLDPDGKVAMQGQRHPIYEVGLENMVINLIEKAQRDREAGPCEVEYVKGVKINRRPCTMIKVVHDKRMDPYDFHVARVYFDDELNIPIRYEAYDWPSAKGAAPQLLEEYTYVNVRPNVGLKEIDFSPDNPAYNFPNR